MTADEKEKLYGDVLQADLDAHRKLETWGSSLFLGALGLLAVQLVVWERSADPMTHIPLTIGMVLLPAAVGCAAFLFLRVVNFRSHKYGWRLRKLAGHPYEGLRGSWGALGLLLAIMPLVFGYLVSWDLAVGDLAVGKPERQDWFLWALLVGVLELIAGLVVHFFYRCKILPHR